MLLYLGRKREAVNACSYIWEENERLLIHALISGKQKRGLAH